jgi:hypothetical protein
MNFAKNLAVTAGGQEALTAEQFKAKPKATLFEYFLGEDKVKPFFDQDLKGKAYGGSPGTMPTDAQIATAKADFIAFLNKRFPENTGVNVSARHMPGKISFHYTLSGMATTNASMLLGDIRAME